MENKTKLQNILDLYWDDLSCDVFPRDRSLAVIDNEGIQGMNTENIRFLIHLLVKYWAHNGIYLEVGSWQGASLISAALFNTTAQCLSIDNFSEFQFSDRNNRDILAENIKKFPQIRNIILHEGAYLQQLPEICSTLNKKVNVYFYDGAHDYISQKKGLEAILPYLADDGLIVVDDVNWKEVAVAVNDFLFENSQFQIIWQVKTGDFSKDKSLEKIDPCWWNGILVLSKKRVEVGVT